MEQECHYTQKSSLIKQMIRFCVHVGVDLSNSISSDAKKSSKFEPFTIFKLVLYILDFIKVFGGAVFIEVELLLSTNSCIFH